MVRYIAVMLVLVLGAASARMLLCESSCVTTMPASATEACHDQATSEEPVAQLTNAHSCDHSNVVFTVVTNKVTFDRFASIIAVPAFASGLATDQSIGLFAYSPPDRSSGSRTRAVTNLRI